MYLGTYVLQYRKRIIISVERKKKNVRSDEDFSDMKETNKVIRMAHSTINRIL